MKCLFQLILAYLFSFSLVAQEQEPETTAPVAGADSYTDKVVVIKVGEKSLMNKHSFKYWRKVMRRAQDQKAKAVVFDIDTPGGYAIETADLITRVMPDLTIPSIAFVNPEATSAGSMIAFGCDKIYMHPRGTIGSTGIVAGGGGEIDPVMRSKIESLFSSYIKIVAKEKGRNADVMKAMMFRDQEYEFADGKVKVAKGELLNLIADEAVLLVDGKPLLADGICKDLEEVLKAEGLEGTEVVVAEPKGLEAFAHWVGLVSPLLISIGVLALFMEFKTPGIGIFGVVALVAFALFFVGNNIDGNVSGSWLFVLFIAGLILVILEFWVIPGTFVAGAVGVVMMGAALILAMVDVDMLDSFKDTKDGLIGFTALLGWPLIYMTMGLFIAVLGSFVAMRFMPVMPMYGSLAVEAELASGTGEENHNDELVGKEGMTVTELRPSGRVRIDGEIHEVVSQAGFVEVDAKVRVVSADGMRILVDLVG
ncbi:nodulation protein NfeD [Rubritalea tangerina]|uniref:Nodulation protein NfeD n=1 Tax=Rubritalea tangerina TaxID=430798 RepID=A0ABW4Z7Z0_9BACT